MKKLFRLLSILLCLLVLLTFSSCAKNNKATINWYDYNAKLEHIVSKKVCENANFSLLWNSDTAVVTLHDKIRNVDYCSIPDKAEENTTQPTVFSPIIVNYIENDTLNSNNVSAYSHSIKSKDFSVKLTENGITVTYYFKKVAISVPVNYILRDDSLEVSINPADIGEDLQYCYNIEVMPFFCSVNNNDNSENSYLFVPSGSGALIYPKILGEGLTSIISDEVYGNDDISQDDSPTQSADVCLPVYGAKNGDKAMCAIIENASETASVTTNVGSSTYAYSSVYSTFNIRGSEVHTTTIMGELASKKTLFCKDKTGDVIKIGFYPLYGENANYVGMAKVYQKYLTEKLNMKKAKSCSELNLNYIGGTITRSYFAGIPYEKLNVLTAFSDIDNEIKEISKSYDGKINIKLTGFGQSGLSIRKIAGSFDYNNKFGNIKELNNLVSNDKINTYFNFDILHFNKSGNGISSFTDVARSAIGDKKVKRDFSVALHEVNWTGDSFWTVKREKLNKSSQKAAKAVNSWKMKGISFDTLSSRAYSDYSSDSFYAKSGYSKQVKDIVGNLNKTGLDYSSTGGNLYSAILAKHIFNAPTSSSNYNIFDLEIPFYQLVFKGYVSMSTCPINFSSDRNSSYLKAVSTGMGLGYTLIAKHNTDVFTSNDNHFYAAVWEDNKKVIKSDLKNYSKLFSLISNACIENYEIMGDLHITTFENGVKVYTNFGDNEIETDLGLLPAQTFIYEEMN